MPSKKRLEAMTEEQRERKRERKRERQRKWRASMTEEQRERERERNRKWRASMTEEQRERERERQRVASMTEEQRERERKRERKRRTSMTEEQRERQRKRQRERNRRSRGIVISNEQWSAMFESQGTCCAICRSDSPRSKHWNTDHCHETGRVRGILCGACNTGLGYFRDEIVTMEHAIQYLRTHRACGHLTCETAPAGKCLLESGE